MCMHLDSFDNAMLLYIICTAVVGVSRLCCCLQDDWTPLHLAAIGGKVDMVRLLTDAHAEINLQTEV